MLFLEFFNDLPIIALVYFLLIFRYLEDYCAINFGSFILFFTLLYLIFGIVNLYIRNFFDIK